MLLNTGLCPWVFGACLCMIAPASFAVMPVHDAGNLQQQLLNYSRMYKQLEQLIAQVDQAKLQYKALTDNRGLGTFSHDPQLREYLPSDWQETYDKVRSGGYQGLTNAAQSIRDAEQLAPCESGLMTPLQKQVCEREAAKAAQDKAYALDAFEKSKQRLRQIEVLMTQSNKTQDLKATAEIQARLASEQALIQNEHTKLQLFKMISDTEDRLIKQQKNEAAIKAWQQTNSAADNLQPITFK